MMATPESTFTDAEDDWPHEIIKRAATSGGYKRESYTDGRSPTWTLDENALVAAINDYHEVVVPDQKDEAWRLVGMMEHPTESVFVNGHGFYESMAIHIRRALDRAYQTGAMLHITKRRPQ